MSSKWAESSGQMHISLKYDSICVHILLITYGWSPFHFANAHGHHSLVEPLIKSGAELDIQTKVHQLSGATYQVWGRTGHLNQGTPA